MAKIKLESYDDWRELYVDGVLHYDGHEIPDFTWIEVLNNLGHAAESEWHDRHPDDVDLEDEEEEEQALAS